ncbi:MAG: DUF1801 domain-containing protein [Bacteroidota bacterium]|nr:DUF1801 domain-containing protein [Bacteroidota bacterium]
MNPKVDFYFSKAKKWQKELEQLRIIVLDCGLNEDLKWGVPCYSFKKSNIVLIHVFKEYCAVLFFKGALLKDAKSVLIQQTKNVQSARQMRFTSVQEIIKSAPTLKAYIREAIKVEKSGLKMEFKKTTEFAVPEEFKNKLDEAPSLKAPSLKAHSLKAAFKALTPGRQRGYLLYFSSAKQSKTREARIEKYIKQILKGKGLDD